MLLAKGSKTKHKPLQQEPELDSKFHSSPSPPGPAQESPESNSHQGGCCWIPNRDIMCPGKTINHGNGGTATAGASATRSSCLSNQWTGWEEAVTTHSNQFFFFISHFSYKAWRNSKGRRWLTRRWRDGDVGGNFRKSSARNPSPESQSARRRQWQLSPTKKSRSCVLLCNEQSSLSFCYIHLLHLRKLLLQLKTRVKLAFWSSEAYLQSWWSL